MRAERGLYAIVDPAATRGRDPERVAEAVLRGGCSILQLRAKDVPDSAQLELARRIGSRCRAAGVAFVVNDRPDLAVLAHADGLHLGQDDLPIAEARRIAGALTIGRSTHAIPQVARAVADGADIIAFGPVFATSSKRDPDPVVGLDALAAACVATALPVVAIGGIDVMKAASVVAAGARWGAAIGAICSADDPEAAARALHHALGGTA